MNSRRLRDLKIQYVVSLVEILHTMSEASEKTSEHKEAIRQVECALLALLSAPTVQKSVPVRRASVDSNHH